MVTGRDLAGPAVRQAVTALSHAASAHGPIRGPVTAAPGARGRALLVSVPLAGNGTNGTSNAALLTLRNNVLPRTLGQVPGLSYAVTGNTANNYDDIADLHMRTPLVLAVVALLAFVLLLVAFRSLAIPLISIGLNLLSVGAAYGLITLIFQDGRLEGPLGFTSFGAIVSWVPLFIFVFLFGLSMDYHVFILSRIRELRAGGASTRDAIVGGIANSAGVVTSAAVIMVAVFAILGSLANIQLKMLGVGLALAVLIDATVVRGHPGPGLAGPARRAELVAAALAGLAAWPGHRGHPAPAAVAGPAPRSQPAPARRQTGAPAAGPAHGAGLRAAGPAHAARPGRPH